MGVDFGDYDNDGWLDLTIGNFFGEPCSLYRNQQDGTFVETTWSSRIGPPTIPILTWGSKFLDYDNDGLKDLLRQWPRTSRSMLIALTRRSAAAVPLP